MDDDLEQVRVLLEEGADPNARWRCGDRFPLFEAIHSASYPWQPTQRNRDAIVRLLLVHGADSNQRYCPYETRGGYDPAEWLQTYVTPRCTNERALTPLMGAVGFDYWDVVYRLLEAGARPLDLNWFGGTALDLASSNFTYRLILHAAFPGDAAEQRAAEDLLNRLHIGAKDVVHESESGGIPDAYYDEDGYGRERLLIVAAKSGGISADDLSSWMTRRLRRRAISFESPELIEMLLQNGANPNLRHCDRIPGRGPHPACTPENGTTLLMEAAFSELDEMAAVLRRHGADASLRDWEGRTSADYRRMGEEWRKTNPLTAPRLPVF